LNSEAIYGVGAATLLGGLLSARLVFVALHWPAFRENLLGIVWPLNTGYSLWGGLILGVAAGIFYGRAKQLRLASSLDALVPGLILLLAFVSLADFVAGPGFGTLTRVPWSITQFSVRRHPVQIYEILVGVIALITWWRTCDSRLFPGQLFLLTLTIYAGGRLFVDAYRENAWLTADGYHVLQIISLATMIGGLFLLGRLSDLSTRSRRQ
jgi:phosphatidylglycerol:prolipoprotein diacylglycerol transferase